MELCPGQTLHGKQSRTDIPEETLLHSRRDTPTLQERHSIRDILGQTLQEWPSRRDTPKLQATLQEWHSRRDTPSETFRDRHSRRHSRSDPPEETLLHSRINTSRETVQETLYGKQSRRDTIRDILGVKLQETHYKRHSTRHFMGNSPGDTPEETAQERHSRRHFVRDIPGETLQKWNISFCLKIFLDFFLNKFNLIFNFSKTQKLDDKIWTLKIRNTVKLNAEKASHLLGILNGSGQKVISIFKMMLFLIPINNKYSSNVNHFKRKYLILNNSLFEFRQC